MDSFFDLDQISLIGRPCGHYIFNPISSGRILKVLNVATKSPGGAKIMNAGTIEKLKID